MKKKSNQFDPSHLSERKEQGGIRAFALIWLSQKETWSSKKGNDQQA